MSIHFTIFSSVLVLCSFASTAIHASDVFIYAPDLNLHHLKIPISKQRLTLSLVDKFIQKYRYDQPHFNGFHEKFFDTLISQAQAIAEDKNSSWPQLEHAAAGLTLIINGHPSPEQMSAATACRRQLAPLVENLLEKAIQVRALTISYIAPALFILTGSPELFKQLDTTHRQSFFEEAIRIIEAEITTWDEIEHAIMGLAFCRAGGEKLGLGDPESRNCMHAQIHALWITIAVKHRELIKKTMADAVVYGNSARAVERGFSIYNLVSVALEHIRNTRLEDEQARGVETKLFAKVPALEKELSLILGYNRALADRHYVVELDYWNGIERLPYKALNKVTPPPTGPSLEIVIDIPARATEKTQDLTTIEEKAALGGITLDPVATTPQQLASSHSRTTGKQAITIVTNVPTDSGTSVTITKRDDTVNISLSPKNDDQSSTGLWQRVRKLDKRVLMIGAASLVIALSAGAYRKWGTKKKAEH